jgi:hypothetical protein
VPRRYFCLVRGQVEPGASEVHRQADGLVYHKSRGEQQDGPERQILGFQPELADDEADRADQDHGGQVGQVPLDVEVLFVVVGRTGRHQVRPLALPVGDGWPGRDPGADGPDAGGPLSSHDGGSYRQIT